jgi:hypothetical protein
MLIVRNMDLISLSLNANTAVTSLNGSAGVTLTSVSRATRDRMKEITCQGNLGVNCQNVQDQSDVH